MKNQIQKELEEAKNFLPEFDSDNLIVLSQNNVAKVEAMIKTDSSYAKNANPDYENSSANLFCKLKEEIYNTDDSKLIKEKSMKTIYDVVCAVDRENNTHINADKVGRQEIAERISNLRISDFIKYLKEPEGLELFNLIAKKTTANEKRHRTNISFASKFCHYACFYMFDNEPEQDNYSIYDSVLKKVLPLYAKKYGVVCIRNKLKDYTYYRDIVDKLIKKSNSHISRNGFDHLLWYCNKGRV